jgi:FkbM family methyltransferase
MISVFKIRSALVFYKLKYINKKDNTTRYLKLRNGLKLSVNKDAGDLTTLFEIFVNDDYNFKGDPDADFNILDIGANIGYFSLFISGKFPKARVFSFEPFPDTFRRLSENINNNNISSIKAFKYAVSDFNGKSDFYSFDWAGCNTLIERNFDEGHFDKTTVECVSFDDIFEITGVKGFTFGKIDCEGSEYRIFLNSKDDSICRVKNYIIEVHDDKDHTKTDLIRKFQSLNYKVTDRVNLIEASLKES